MKSLDWKGEGRPVGGTGKSRHWEVGKCGGTSLTADACSLLVAVERFSTFPRELPVGLDLGAGQYLRPLRKDVLIYGLGVPSPPDSNTNPLSGLWSGSLWGPDRVVGRVRRPSCVSYRLRNRPAFRKPPPTPRLEQDRICPQQKRLV